MIGKLIKKIGLPKFKHWALSAMSLAFLEMNLQPLLLIKNLAVLLPDHILLDKLDLVSKK